MSQGYSGTEPGLFVLLMISQRPLLDVPLAQQLRHWRKPSTGPQERLISCDGTHENTDFVGAAQYHGKGGDVYLYNISFPYGLLVSRIDTRLTLEEIARRRQLGSEPASSSGMVAVMSIPKDV